MPYPTKQAFKSLRDATEQRLTGNEEMNYCHLFSLVIK